MRRSCYAARAAALVCLSAAADGDCELLESTKFGEGFIKTLLHTNPTECCQQCSEDVACNSWTVSDFGPPPLPSSDGTCLFFSEDKAAQEQNRMDPDENKGWSCSSGCSRQMNDPRFTSGFLKQPHDDNGDDVIGDIGALAGGWWMVGGLALAIFLYIVVGGAYSSFATGGKTIQLPHPEFWRNVRGLVVDGIKFSTGGSGRGGSISARLWDSETSAPSASSSGAAGTATSESGAGGGREGTEGANSATRGQPTALHTSCSLGDVKRLQKHLKTEAARKHLNAGDKRQYTAFHVACAGGHVGCARLLLQAGCNASLLNDTGVTGWELAVQLQRWDAIGPLQLEFGGTAPAAQPKSATSATVITAAATSGGLSESRALKAELQKLGLSPKGSKAELRARLAAAKSGKSREAAAPALAATSRDGGAPDGW